LFLDSKTYFEMSDHLIFCNRWTLAKTFFEIVALLPVALLWKVWGTFLKGIGFVLMTSALAMTCGIFKGIRNAVVKQATSFAANIADWIMFPFAVLICLLQLIVGCLIHPSLIFR